MKKEETLIEEKLDSFKEKLHNKFTAESGHWYTKEGQPKYTIIGVNGKERKTNLRDARKFNLVPSVTTVMNMIAKPSLENWKMNQILNSALTLERYEGESLKSFSYRCRQDSQKFGKEAAEKGTEIHAMIEKGFLGTSTNKPYKAIKKFLDECYPNEEWIAEGSFCAEKGYGGMIDLYSKSGIFIDFKTKDNLKDKNSKKLVYNSHGIQLSAYAQGCGYNDPERVSIFVDRKDTSLILCHIWDKVSHEKHLSMFNSILTYWKLEKNYNPNEETL